MCKQSKHDDQDESSNKFKKHILKQLEEEDLGFDPEEDEELYYEIERFLKK